MFNPDKDLKNPAFWEQVDKKTVRHECDLTGMIEEAMTELEAIVHTIHDWEDWDRATAELNPGIESGYAQPGQNGSPAGMYLLDRADAKLNAVDDKPRPGDLG